MATIMIGSMAISVPNTHVSCASNSVMPVQAVQMAKQVPSARGVLYTLKREGSTQVHKHEEALRKFQEAFDQDVGIQRRLLVNKHSSIQSTKKNGLTLRRLTLEQARAKEAAIARRKQEEEDFLNGKYEQQFYAGVSATKSMKFEGGSVGFRTKYWRPTPKKTKERRATSQCRKPTYVLEEVLSIASKSGKLVEFITGKGKRVKVCYVRKHGAILPKFSLPHEEGKYIHQELQYASTYEFLPYICMFAKYKSINADDITYGDSGLLFDERSSLTTNHTKLPYFVVRGRRNGKLVNALEVVENMEDIQHYSQNPEAQFFRGWKKVFDKMPPHVENHECTTDFTNEQCGELAAAISQSIFPVKKLSCKQCRQHIKHLSWEEYKQFLLAHMGCHGPEWETFQEIDGMRYVKRVIETSTAENASLQTSLEIVRLTQNYKSTHMLQIQDINKALMKGPSVTQSELEQASKQLLAMTQWWKNHMTLTDEDALKVFRNKRSSKALLNPSLLCDNQLDKNGNFVWGERGRHSKRFFANYFEEVVPSEGYSKYVIRKNPNGQRELAIGSLIVPLDFERARMALQGKSVTREPITMSCISRQDGNFVYPCCCVTHDDGKAFYSELRSPTKRHLVIGTSGDPKYIDLPATDADRMYIAKEGFCYLNIFLAMLVNVNEDEAKDFTKMVRDVIVPRLGKWPTMLDVATAAYMLTVFHPETRNAELPRILVDHACQTMHVIDSFGSLTVGYHVLKAGTVNQLIQFASNDLQSEMKFYRVGGEVQQRMKCETALITSIFKPKRMIQILENDPYILLMGLVSPSILIHMYRMKHFEKGVELWISKEHSVAKIFIILEQLTKRVAANDVLLEQLEMISETSERFMSILEDCPQAPHSYKTAKDLLTMYIERKASNNQLVENGFVDMNDKLYMAYEKNLLRSLEAGMARIKLVGKIFYNMAIEKICSTYGEMFDKESCRRKQRIFRKLCECVLHECPVTPKKCKKYTFPKM
uniref:P3N-PIPO polyprotein n=1 Tax=Soybean mosaic virus (strain N) TaxID=12223 RepID=MVP_SBMVN|nr:RecName: Full=P3N-PIPO polyprotein; Contains: RecName: Full=P1 proteinase; AltName: Full=N-terminal protein; Contains: RecName: Full=Helper component proteinase; Short=HC-pro; Contains: RecName: Full=Movement protein P3N-PIPO; AltName: Full=Pretty interesting potyviridae ORF; Short=PIPO [Soybean mosaic virus N]